MTDHPGACGCGEIQYTVSMPIKRVSNCHCKMCREMNGSAFSSYAIVRESKFAMKGKPVIFELTEKAKNIFVESVAYHCTTATNSIPMPAWCISAA